MEVFNEQGAKNAHLPPLEHMLAKMGKPGELARVRASSAVLCCAKTPPTRLATRLCSPDKKPESTRQSEPKKVPGRKEFLVSLIYVSRLMAGNLASDNVMEVRILAPRGAVASARTAHLVYTSFLSDALGELVPTAYPQATTAGSPTPQNLIQGSIGYAVGQGAQGLIPTPPPPQCPAGQQVIPANLQKPQTSFPPRYA